jgi:multidrug efflux pump subunit AcrB
VEDRPVQLNEIATVEKVPVDGFGVNKRNGYPSYYISLLSGSNSNTVAILDEVNLAIDELNAGSLDDAILIIEFSYDASV